MAEYKCGNCGRSWCDDGDNGEVVEVYYCIDCVPDFQDHEVKAEACEAGTERARADYYKTLCSLQRDLIEKMHKYIHDQNRPVSIDDASHREWSLATQLEFARQYNKALQELADEYQEELKVIRNATN